MDVHDDYTINLLMPYLLYSGIQVQRDVEMLLHPRLPPLLRTQPPMEALSLFRTSDVKKDKAAEEALNVITIERTEARLKPTAPAEQQSALQIDAQPLPLTSTTTTTPGLSVIPAQKLLSPDPVAIASPEVITSAATEPQAPGPSVESLPVTSSEPVATHKPNWAGVAQSEPVQVSTSTSISTSIVKGYRGIDDHSDEDEEMPEIDMASDSE